MPPESVTFGSMRHAMAKRLASLAVAIATLVGVGFWMRSGFHGRVSGSVLGPAVIALAVLYIRRGGRLFIGGDELVVERQSLVGTSRSRIAVASIEALTIEPEKALDPKTRYFLDVRLHDAKPVRLLVGASAEELERDRRIVSDFLVAHGIPRPR